ncbi:MAG TPA: hypothetical protein VGR00_10265, partial [Thermoanaerobaculia bacterium]|nr:hypothetical protein [Thermoanaerobaculia bacterium]
MAADVDPALLAPVADGLAHRVGFRYNPAQPEALWNALSRRAASLGLPDRQSYVAKLRTDEVEWSRLAEEMAIHETCFFRHQ